MLLNRARQFIKKNLVNLSLLLNRLILKDDQFHTVIRSLNIVFIGINIDFVISKLKAN